MRNHSIRTADDLQLHVTDHGQTDGQAVVLVHGWPDTHVVWDHQIEVLSDAGFRVIAHDQRGFGESDRPPAVEGSHVFRAMADLGTIMDSLEIEAAHLVGHDWGAPPCWLAATLVPDRVRSLTAVSVGHPTAFKIAGLEQLQRSFYMLLFQFEDVAEQWLRSADWANFRALLGDTADTQDRIEALSADGALTASLNWYRANVAPQTLIEEPVELAPVTVPTMGIMGRRDFALTPKQMQDSEHYVSGAWRYEMIEDAAHWVQRDQPEVFNDLLLNFWSTV